MRAGKGRALGRTLPRLAGALAVCAALTGCAALNRVNVEKHLLDDKTQRHAGVTEQYRVGCPDVLEIRLDDRPELSGRHTIPPSGRVELGDYAKIRVEGKTLAEIAQIVAQETGVPPEAVHVRVLEFHSQHVVLFGQVIGWQRTVPYQGQETVLDVLQRVGGITPGAEPEDVWVVRVHLEDSQRPEVFHVDLKAIVLKHDHKTNIRLMPFDQVYVGETRQARVEKSFPPWLRPAYQAAWRMLPRLNAGPGSDAPPLTRWITGLRPTGAEPSEDPGDGDEE